MHGLQEIIAMNGNDDQIEEPVERMSPRLDEVREYLSRDIRGFLSDLPSNSYQVGYLAALVAVAKEGFKEDMTAWPYADAERLLNAPVAVLPPARTVPVKVAGPASPWCPDTIGPSSEWPRKLGQERLEVSDAGKLVFKPVEGAKCNNEYTDKSGHKHYNHAARVAEWNERVAG